MQVPDAGPSSSHAYAVTATCCEEASRACGRSVHEHDRALMAAVTLVGAARVGAALDCSTAWCVVLYHSNCDRGISGGAHVAQSCMHMEAMHHGETCQSLMSISGGGHLCERRAQSNPAVGCADGHSAQAAYHSASRATVAPTTPQAELVRWIQVTTTRGYDQQC